MPILDLQRRDVEHGRIRFGLMDKNKPQRLDAPIFTTPDGNFAKEVAEDLGGLSVVKWPGDPNQAMIRLPNKITLAFERSREPCSQWWEQWSAGGCIRRCDGIRDTIFDKPCDCDKESGNRKCKPTTRVLAAWPFDLERKIRIETHSLYAAIEMPQDLSYLIGSSEDGEVINGTLEIVKRKGPKGPVPVPKITLINE